jgi:hypothetical protein
MRTAKVLLLLGLCAAAACGNDGAAPTADADSSTLDGSIPDTGPSADGSTAGTDADPNAADGSTADGSTADGSAADADLAVADAAPATDAPPVGDCHELDDPATVISAYPATYEGDLAGGGADLSVPQGLCDVDGFYQPLVGADRVIGLAGLSPGQTYQVELQDNADLAFYVITGCDDSLGGPAAGQCPILADNFERSERGVFVAAATEAYLVVDTTQSGDFDGHFSVTVGPPECVADSDCGDAAPRCLDYTCVACIEDSDCGDAAPRCLDHTCVACIEDSDCIGGPVGLCLGDHECGECTDDFDCSDPASPTCDPATYGCIPAPNSCVADDPGEPDEGPTIAHPLAVGTPVVAAICAEPSFESDEYSVAASGAARHATITWSGDAQLIANLHDEHGTWLNSTVEASPATLDIPAGGPYYIRVVRYTPSGTAVTAYTLLLAD